MPSDHNAWTDLLGVAVIAVMVLLPWLTGRGRE